jgi:hypothetical protein
MSPIAPAETQPLDALLVDDDVLQVCGSSILLQETIRTRHLTFSHFDMQEQCGWLWCGSKRFPLFTGKPQQA